MITGIIIYGVIYLLILSADYAVRVIGIKCVDKPKSANLLRITGPLLTLFAIFSVPMAAAALAEIFKAFTVGAVNTLATIFGVAAIVYSLDYALTQYRLRNHDAVATAISADEFRGAVISGGILYIRRGDTDDYPAADQAAVKKAIKKNTIGFAVLTAVILSAMIFIAVIANI